MCLENNLTPKFVNFKLYRKDIRHSKQSTKFQTSLLNNEIYLKRKENWKTSNLHSFCFNQLKNLVSIFDFNHLFNFVSRVNEKKIKQIKHSQNKKLFNLGLQHEVTRLNPQNLISNYSDKKLTDEEIDALSHGLKFGLPPKKINYSRWFLVFEKLFLKFKDCDILTSANDDSAFFTSSLKTLAYKTYYSFRPRNNFLYNSVCRTLTTLKNDPNIVILKADKGNSIVILNKSDYTSKMNNILDDSSKFKLLSGNIFNALIFKDKINRLLTKIKEKFQKTNITSCVLLELNLESSMACQKFTKSAHLFDLSFLPSEMPVITLQNSLCQFLFPLPPTNILLRIPFHLWKKF